MILSDGELTNPVKTQPPIRILFVMAWLVVGGEETEVRLLAKSLDPALFRIEVLPCFRRTPTPSTTTSMG